MVVVLGTRLGHGHAARALGDVIGAVGLVRQLQAGLAAEGAERGLPVHGDAVFGPEVQIELLGLPHAVEIRGVRINARIAGRIPGLEHGGRGDLVHRVAVFAILRLGDHHGGLILAQQAHGPGVDLVLAAEGLVLRGEILLVAVAEAADVGIGAHAQIPQGIQQLGAAGRVGIAHVGHDDVLLQLACVGRDAAAEEDQLVIRVRGDEEHVRRALEGLPALHPLRHVARAEGEDFIDIQGEGAVVLDIDAHARRALRDGLIHMIKTRITLGVGHPVAALQHLEFIAVRHGGEAHVHAVDRRAARRGQRHGGMLHLVALPHGGVLAVRHLGNLELGGRRLDLALAGDVRGLVAQGQSAAGQHRQHEQQRP